MIAVWGINQLRNSLTYRSILSNPMFIAVYLVASISVSNANAVLKSHQKIAQNGSVQIPAGWLGGIPIRILLFARLTTTLPVLSVAKNSIVMGMRIESIAHTGAIQIR